MTLAVILLYFFKKLKTYSEMFPITLQLFSILYFIKQHRSSKIDAICFIICVQIQTQLFPMSVCGLR